ncbi:MAG: NitT/TauT family transport system ATP-binding protein [Gammaproteobacteria bacterium]|jgi:NitT/TauT family transport system ATP-binding protein
MSENISDEQLNPSGSTVSLRGVKHVYEGVVHALGPIDLDLKQGEFFSTIGPSGCGKTTMMDIVAGLTLPTEGQVTFEGKPVRDDVPEGVGIVFQDDASFPWLTVRDNIAFGLRRAGGNRKEIDDQVDYAIEFMGLQGFADARPSELSGGMRQRVCIARTFVMKPRLILLDEPFGSLDQQTRFLMGDELLRLWRETGATVLLITHSLDEAAILSDRIGIMSARPGNFIDIVETGWPAERDSRLATHDEFGQVTTKLWDKLREESKKAMGDESR